MRLLTYADDGAVHPRPFHFPAAFFAPWPYSIVIAARFLLLVLPTIVDVLYRRACCFKELCRTVCAEVAEEPSEFCADPSRNSPGTVARPCSSVARTSTNPFMVLSAHRTPERGEWCHITAASRYESSRHSIAALHLRQLVLGCVRRLCPL